MKVFVMKINNKGPKAKTIDLVPDILKNKVNFIISTRQGGISKTPYDSLNVSFKTGDLKESVEGNRNIYFSAAGCDGNKVYQPEQIHGDKIVVIKKNDLFLIPAADSLITNEKKAVLSIMTADCLPILIFDPVNEAFGIIHSGWKGTLLFLVNKTLDNMKKYFNSRAEDCHAVMGPAICQNCYEISNDLVEKIREAFNGKELYVKRKNNKIYFDLVGINTFLLQEAGLAVYKIHKTGLCTFCLPDQFYSHRRDHGKTGRMMSLAWMK